MTSAQSRTRKMANLGDFISRPKDHLKLSAEYILYFCLSPPSYKKARGENFEFIAPGEIHSRRSRHLPPTHPSLIDLSVRSSCQRLSVSLHRPRLQIERIAATMASAELAATYASLILADEEIEITVSVWKGCRERAMVKHSRETVRLLGKFTR